MTARWDAADTAIKDSVVQELAWAPDVDPAALAVSVAEGVVTLTGEVGSFAEEVVAGEAVLRVNGVRALAQDVRVRTARSDLTDGDIARTAGRALEQTVDVPDTVDLVVDDGVVTLSGTVRWQFQRVASRRAVSHLRGVAGVVDLTTLEAVPTPGDAASRIHDALVRTTGVVGRTLTVVVDQQGAVRLTGHIGSVRDRRAAEEACWGAPGVTSVVNALRTIG